MTRSAQTDRFVHDRLPPRAQWPELRHDLPELQFPDQVNLVERLLDGAAAKGWADRPLLRSPQVTFTYAEVRERVDRIANHLMHGLKLEPGNRVLLRGGNSIGMALSWLAVVKAGLIAVATMPLFRAAELSKVIDKAQPVAAICDARLLPELEQAQRAHPDVLQHVLRFNAPDDPQDLGALAARQPPRFTACPTAADDIALLAFTSGTTGAPKAVVHTHRDVLAACECWPRHVLKPTPDDVVTGSPPLAFTFGLGGLLLFPMWAGASIFYPDGPYNPESMVRQMRAHGVTTCRYMDDERQARYVPDGWNRPGDAFVQDADDYFHYQARDDDMIITAGYNVGGPEVEDCLLTHPAVAECGVSGKPDEARGMLIKAFVVLKPGHAGDAAMVKALQEHVKQTIAPYKYPREIEFMTALPRTETGKLQRFRLRQNT